MAGSRVLVTFDGVMTDATVVLNGRVVATHAVSQAYAGTAPGGGVAGDRADVNGCAGTP